jgi:two-component system, NarL family, nitrate/nitrite response regulator NarL
MARCDSRSTRAHRTREPSGSDPPAAGSRVVGPVRTRVAVVVVGGADAAVGPALPAGAPLIQVVGQAPVGSSARALVARVRPDVVLLHVEQPGADVDGAIDEIQAEHPPARIVVVGRHRSDRRAGDGTSGVVVTDGAFTDVVAGIRTAMAGAAPVLRNGQRPGLTRREDEILRLVALGHTNSEIAQRLGLAANTVKTYWQRTLHKLAARNRAEAIARAHELRLI